MPTSDLNVFEYFQADDATDLEIDYLSYAIFARRRLHWAARFRELNNRQPDQTEIDAWINQLSGYDLDMMRSEAADIFHDAASRFMSGDIDKARMEGREDTIACSVAGIRAQITSMGRVKNQVIVGVITAIITPVVLGSTFFFWQQYEKYMPSPLSLFREPTSPQPAPVPSPAHTK